MQVRGTVLNKTEGNTARGRVYGTKARGTISNKTGEGTARDQYLQVRGIVFNISRKGSPGSGTSLFNLQRCMQHKFTEKGA